MKQEQIDNLMGKMTQMAGQPLTDKDIESLEKMLSSEPLLKALGQLYASAFNQAQEFMNVDFAQPESVAVASRIQGAVRGAMSMIQDIFNLTLQEEIEPNGSPEPS